MELLIIDSQTWIITVVGWLIVFTALVALVIVFVNLPKLFNIKLKKSKAKGGTELTAETGDKKYITGDETAAIAMALYLFFEEQHDEESNIITIKRIERRYSPWSSKIYGVRNFPNN
jgi:glutaconyl-CoA/methylmalonyl-CoA decarboxylase subunit delta